MNCYTSWNGKKSVLATALTQAYGEQETSRIMNYVYSTDFKTLHGDFKNTIAPNMPVDAESQEPTFEWVTTNLLTSIAADQQKHVIAVQDAITSNLPVEIVNTVSILNVVPQEILGRDDLFLSMKDVLSEKGITDEALINWVGINKGSTHPSFYKSEEHIRSIVEEAYKKLADPKNHPELKTNELAKESFSKWVNALETFPVTYRHLMLKHAVKQLNPQRRSKYVLQLSTVALKNTYGILQGKPHEANRIGKLYDQEVLKTVSDAIGHEPSASGVGYWVHVPRTKNKNALKDIKTLLRDNTNDPNAPAKFTVEYMTEDGYLDLELFKTREEAERFEISIKGNNIVEDNTAYKTNVELLRKLSPSTWCTSGSMASHYVENYDNYILVVDGRSVAGIEVIPGEGMRKVKEVTSVNNNGVASIDYLDDTIAFFEKHNLDTNNDTLQRAITYKNKSKTDSNLSPEYDVFVDPFDFDYDLPNYYDVENYEEFYQPEIDEYEDAVTNIATAEEFLNNINNNQRWMFNFFEKLKQEIKDNEQVARTAVAFDPHNIIFINQNLPFYSELLLNAMQRNPNIYAYLSVEEKAIPELKALFDAEHERRLTAATLTDDDLPFSKTNDSLIQGYYDVKTDKVVVIASNVTTQEAPKVAIHEVAHRGMLRMAKELGGFQEITDALLRAESQLMEKLPELLKRTGHTTLESLLLDYGFDSNSTEGKTKLLMELAARWAETLVDKPKPSWWVELLQSIGQWLTKFTGNTLTEEEVNSLVGGFVKYGTKETVQDIQLATEPTSTVISAPALPTLPLKQARKYYEVTVDNVNEMRQWIKDNWILPALQTTDTILLPLKNPLSKESLRRDTNGMTAQEYVTMVAEIKAEMKDTFPTNLKFSKDVEAYMNNSPEVLRSSVNPDTVGLGNLKLDPEAVKEQRMKTEVPLVDANNKTIGYLSEFGQDFQLEIASMALYSTYKVLTQSTAKTPPIQLALRSALNSLKIQVNLFRKDGKNEEADKLEAAIRSFSFPAGSKVTDKNGKVTIQKGVDQRKSILQLVLNNMEALGYVISAENSMKLQNLFYKLKDLPANSPDLLNDDAKLKLDEITEKDAVTTPNDDIEGEESEVEALNAGQIYRENYDNVTKDQRNTTSVHVKMWLSTFTEEESFNFIVDENGNSVINPKKPTNIKKNSIGMSVYYATNFDEIFSKCALVLAGQPELTVEKAATLLKTMGGPSTWKVGHQLMSDKTPLIIKHQFMKAMYQQNKRGLEVRTKLVETGGDEGGKILDVKVRDLARSGNETDLVDKWREEFALSPIVKVVNNKSVIDIEEARKHWNIIKFFNKLEDLRFKPANFSKLGSNVQTALISYNEIESQRVADAKAAIQDEFENSGIRKYFKGTLEQLIEDEYPTKPLVDEQGFSTPGKIDFSQKRKIVGGIIQKMFAEYGIDLPDGAIETMTRSYNGKDNIENFMKTSWKGCFGMYSLGAPGGPFSYFFAKAAGEGIFKEDQELSDEGMTKVMLNNPLVTETTTMKMLAKLTMMHTPIMNTSTYRSTEGKTISLNQLNTSLSDQVQLMQNNWQKFAEEAEKSILVRNGCANFMNYFGVPQNRNKFALSSLSGLNHNEADKGVVRQYMSLREQIQTALGLFYQQPNTVSLMSLSHSDKTETPIFQGLPRYNIGKCIQELEQKFMAEYSRVLEHQRMTENNLHTDAQFKEGGKYFYFLPFNKSQISGKSENADMGKVLWNEDGTIKKLSETQLRQFLKDYGTEYITEYLKKQIAKDLANVEDLGIGLNNVDQKVIKRISKEIASRKDYNSEDVAGNKRRVLEQVVMEFSANYAVHSMNMSMLFFGDPALAFKNDVASTMKEYSKRTAKDIAPGSKGQFEDTQYNQLVFADVKDGKAFKQDYMKELRGITSFNGTDAQEFTTVMEHLNVMKAYGLIDSNLFDELKGVVDNADKNGFYKFTDDQLKQMLQPMQAMKPVVAGWRSVNNGNIRYLDYIKSSSYPLLPQFTVRSKHMDNLRKLAEGRTVDGVTISGGVQRITFESAVKMGKPTKLANFTQLTSENLLPAIQQVDRANFKIQQDIPYDEAKEEVKIVSQMNKLIVEGINSLDFQIDGTTVKGKELRRYKERLRAAMAQKEYPKVLKALGINEESRDLDKAILVARLEEEAKSRGYTSNDLVALKLFVDTKVLPDGNTVDSQEFVVPFLLHTAQEKFESLIMSMIKKVTTTKIPGKSYVQASSTGYFQDVKQFNDLTAEQKAEIVFVEGYDGTEPLKHQRIEDGVVKPAQVLAPFNFHINGKLQSVKDYVKVDENGRTMLDLERVPQELLRLVGARIPNQGHNSMLAMEIVGFVPDWMGDVMFVPDMITGQMGSDFDVDKIYTYKFPYSVESTEKVNSFKPLDNRLTINEDLGGLRMAEEETEDFIVNQYVALHWAILTDPVVSAEKVTKALDLNDLTLMNEKFPNDSNEDWYWSGFTQMSQFDSGKDAKTLVGGTSLAVTCNSDLQGADVRLGSYDKDGEVPEVIVLNGMSFDRLSGEGYSEYTYKDKKTGGMVTNRRSKHENHTVYQSAAVDNAKDRLLDYLNINLATYPAIQFLHQLGNSKEQALGVDFVIALMLQAPVKKFAKMMSNAKDSISEFPKNAEKIFDEIEASYKKVEESNEDLNTANLTELTETKELTPEQRALELNAFRAFRYAYEKGQDLGKLQKTINQDTNGAGKNFIYAQSQAENKTNLFNLNQGRSFIGGHTLLTDNIEKSTLFNLTIGLATDLQSDLMPMRAMQEVNSKIAVQMQTSLTSLSNEKALKLQRAYKAAVLSSPLSLGVDKYAERIRLLYGTATEPSLAQRVFEWRKENPGNYFIERIKVQGNKSIADPSTISYENGKAVLMDTEANINAFMSMFNSTDKKTAQLAKDIATYALLLSPNNGPNSFISKVPSALLLSKEFSQELRDMEAKVGNITRQYFQHNPTDAVKMKYRDISSYKINDGLSIPEVFNLNNSNRKVLEPLETDDGAVSYFHVEFPSGVALYAHVGGLTYQRIDTLGKGALTEYDLNTAQMRSVFPKNRAYTSMQQTGTATNEEKARLNREVKEAHDKNGNYLKNLEGTTVGTTEIQYALDLMSVNVELPGHLRVLADQMSLMDLRGEDQLASLLGDTYGQLSLEVNNGNANLYSIRNNKITLGTNRGQSSIAKMSGKLLHELTHVNSSAVLSLLGFGNKPGYTTVIKNNQVLFKKAARLDKLRYQALSAFRNGLSEERRAIADRLIAIMKEESTPDRDARLREVEKEMKPTNEEFQIMYALSSVTEFIPGVLTEGSVIKFLNTVEGDKAWYQNLIDNILDFLTSMLESIGVTVNDKSILKEAYALAYDIVKRTDKLELTRNADGKFELGDNIFASEYNAIEQSAVVEKVYGIENDVVDLGTHYSIAPVTPNKSLADARQLEILRERLELQLDQVNTVIAINAYTPEEFERRGIAEKIYDEISEDLSNVIREKDLLLLNDIATKQLDWARTLLNRKAMTHEECSMISTLLKLWEGITDIYTPDSPKLIPTVYEQMGNIRKQLDGLIPQMQEYAGHTLIKVSAKAGFTVETKDFTDDLMNPNLPTKWGLVLARDLNRAVQSYAIQVKMAADMAQEAQLEHRDALVELKNLMKEYQQATGKTEKDVMDLFIQSDPSDPNMFGLTQRLNSQWYTNNSKILSKHIDTLWNAKRNSNAPAEVKKAWDRYWETKKDQMIIDPNVFFNYDGTRKLGEDSAEYKALVDFCGSKEIVDDAIRSTQATIQRFNDSKNVRKNHILDNVKLTPGEDAELVLAITKSFTSTYAVGTAEYKAELDAAIETKREEALKNKAATEFTRYQQERSPFFFTDTQAKPEEHPNLRHTGYYAPAFIPKSSSSNIDPKYNVIMGDKRLSKIYETFKNMSKEFRSYLPFNVQNQLHENFLPITNAADVEEHYGLLTRMQNTNVGKKIFHAFSVTEEQVNRVGNGSIPLMYTKGNKATASRDLFKMFEMFGNMAIHFHYMAPMEAQYTTMKTLINKESQKRKNSENKEKPELTNLMDAVDYYNDALVRKKAINVQGVSKKPIFTANPLKWESDTRRYEALRDKKEEIVEKLKTLDVELQKEEIALLEKELAQVNKEFEAMEDKKRYFAVSKAGDTLMGINQLRALAFSPFSAFSNLSYGLIAVHIYSMGFRADKDGYTSGEFSSKQYGTALKMMWGNVKKTVGSIRGAKGSDQAQKIKNFLDRIGLIDQFLDTQAGKSNLTELERSNLKKTFDPMAWQKNGDFLTKGAMALAMALNTKVEVNGVTTNLFEALGQDAKWDEEANGKAENWYAKDKTLQTDWNKFKTKVRHTSLIVFGNQDKNSPLYSRKEILGRLIGQFRASWLYEGINARWGGESQEEDVVLGRKTKGRYRTYIDLGSSSFKVVGKQMLSVINKSIDPYEGLMTDQWTTNAKGEKIIKKMPIREFEIENLRRNMAELSYGIGLYALTQLIRMMLKGLDDDDEAEKKFVSIMSNILYRNYQDVSMYSDYGTFSQFTGSLIPAASLVQDTWKAIKATAKLTYEEDPDLYRDLLLKWTKVGPYVNNANKFDFMMNRSLEDIQR
jgi:hypothetical protein